MFVGLCFLLTSLVTVCFGVTAVETHDRRGGVLSVWFFFLMYGKIKEMQNSHTNEFNLAARSTETSMKM